MSRFNCIFAAARAASLFPLLLFAACVQAGEAAEHAVGPERLEGLIREAAASPEPAFRLEVDCTDQNGNRSFVLYPEGVLVWRRARQAIAPAPLRSALLQDLMDSGFPRMEALYGEDDEAGEYEGPVRIDCMVNLEIGGAGKISMQRIQGPQSAELRGLARKLLDRVEPLGKAGTGAASLQEGLELLAAGKLAPQVLELRLLVLPPPTEKQASGSILRIQEGRASRQRYAPARELGPEEPLATNAAGIRRLAGELAKADIGSLPNNLWSEGQVQLDVAVLDQRKTVLAQPFGRLRGKQPVPGQERFEAVLELLRGFGKAE